MIPLSILNIIAKISLPAFIYDTGSAAGRIKTVQQFLDEYYYPVKTCPVEKILETGFVAGIGFDLCSSGDLDLVMELFSPSTRLSFTSAHTDAPLLDRLVNVGAKFDADSVAQAMAWQQAGGRQCGLRICVADSSSPYGIKFGITLNEIDQSILVLEKKGVSVCGLHIHESHVERSPKEMADRLTDLFLEAGPQLVSRMRYINIGGGWPMLKGLPWPEKEMETALDTLRATLRDWGFAGMLTGEPGEWVIGPAGYWVARVSATKPHPFTRDKKICVLDTATPIPCRPSQAPFFLLDSQGQKKETGASKWDIFGSANTGLDTVGVDILLGDVQPGDIIISCCQGAYVRSLIGSFNERPLPLVITV